MDKNLIVPRIRSKMLMACLVLFVVALIDKREEVIRVGMEGESNHINLKAMPPYTLETITGGKRLKISGTGEITSSISTLVGSEKPNIIEIEINGNDSGITVKYPLSESPSQESTFQGFSNVRKINIFGRVSLNRQTFLGLTELTGLYVESTYTIDLGQSGFYGCTKLKTIVLKAPVILQCWTFGGTTSITDVYYFSNENPRYTLCLNFQKPPSFRDDETYLNSINIHLPAGSAVTEFANAKRSKFSYTANVHNVNNFVFYFEGTKVRITGRGEITTDILAKVHEDTIACSCTNNNHFTTVNLESSGGAISVRSSDNTATFSSFSNLANVNLIGDISLGHWAFREMTRISNLEIETDTVVHLGDACFQDCTGLTNVIIYGSIKAGCWVFIRCSGLSSFFYCAEKNPEFLSIGYCKNESAWTMFSGTPASLVIKVPYRSNITKFAEKSVSKGGNVYTRGSVKLVLEKNRLIITGSENIDPVGSDGLTTTNNIVKDFINKGGCFSCKSYDDIKTVEFFSDGTGTLVTPYYTGGNNQDGYLMFLQKLEVAIFGDDVKIRHHIFYGMQSLKTVIINGSTKTTIAKDAFELCYANKFIISPDIVISEHVFLGCNESMDVYVCGNVEYDYGTNADIKAVFTKRLSNGKSGTYVPRVHIPVNSTLPSFSNVNGDQLMRDANTMKDGNINYTFFPDLLTISGNGDIDTRTTNSKARNIIDTVGCYRCLKYDEIKKLEFKSDGNGVLSTPYYTGPGEINTVAYLGFLPKLETVIFRDDVTISHHIFYGMESLKTVIINSTKKSKVLKDAFESCHAVTYHFTSDVILGSHVFLNSQDHIRDIYVCGNVEFNYENDKHVFTIGSDPYTTYSPNVHVSSNSSLTSFDTVDSSMLIRDANMNQNGDFKFYFFRDRVKVVGHGQIDTGESNDVIRDILFKGKCLSCLNYNNIKTIEFQSDGADSLRTPYFTLRNGVQGYNTVAYFGFLGNLDTAIFTDNIQIGHHAFYGMQNLRTVIINGTKRSRINKDAFELSYARTYQISSDVIIEKNAFLNCNGKVENIYLCRDAEKANKGSNIFTTGASEPYGTFIPKVHVPTNSSIKSFDTVSESALLRDANVNQIGDIKFSFFGDRVHVSGHGTIDPETNNNKIRDILNYGQCFSCRNYSHIKTIEFQSDGTDTLKTPYYKLAIGDTGYNEVAYLGFLENLETAIIREGVEVNHHIFYKMPRLKSVIVNSSTKIKIGKDAFESSHAETYQISSDVVFESNVFLNCKEHLQEIYLCGNVEFDYKEGTNNIFTTRDTIDSPIKTFTPDCVHIPSNSSLTRIDTVQNNKLIRDANIFTVNNVNFTFFRNSIDVTGSGSISNENVRSISYSTKCISCNSYNNIESINFDGDFTIGGQTFSGINSLTSLTFNNVQIIGERSFKSCDIRTIFMSGDVRQIEDEAFADNANLGLVSFCGQTDPGTGFTGQFDGCPASLNIKVMLSDQNFVGYTGNTFCSKTVEHFYGHEFCGVATFQFTHSSDFSPSTKFTSSDIFLMTNQFSLTNIFSATKSFTETNHFQNSNYFIKSCQFSMTKQFTKTYEMSKSSIFMATRDFTQSSQFENSKEFSSSEKFGASNSFSRSSDLSKSNIFSASMKFTPSMFVNQTNYFSPSMTFSKSKQFSSSGQFEKSKMFTKSSEFMSSNQFTESKTHKIKSNSNQFTKSNEFSSSSKFKESTQFTQSLKFGRTIEFSASSQFSSSLKFTRSAHFTASSEFNPSLKFTRSAHFTASSEFNPSSKFTQSNRFTAKEKTSEVESTFYDDLVNNNPLIEAKNSKGIAIGVSVGVFILLAIIAALIVFFVVCKKKEKVSEEYEGELETEPYSNDETTSRDTSLFDGTTTQDNPIWTTINPTVDIESSVNFNYEEGYGVFFNSINKLE